MSLVVSIFRIRVAVISFQRITHSGMIGFEQIQSVLDHRTPELCKRFAEKEKPGHNTPDRARERRSKSYRHAESL